MTSSPFAPDDLDVHLRAIMTRDPTAFGRWVAGVEGQLRAALRPFARRLDTEAILQEALLRTWLAAPDLEKDGKPNALLRLAVVIARNHAISELRRHRVEPHEIEDLERRAETLGANIAPAAPPDPGLRNVIRRCIGTLPDAPRRAIGARIANAGTDPDDVLAGRLGMKKNTFLQNITRARRLLASCLEQSGVNLGEELR